MIVKKNLAELRDDKTVLENPHKGWYWHYIDNGLKNCKYRDKTDGYEAFPGMNHLYLRVDWADIQPRPDEFDWSAVDEIMNEWGKKGYRFALRVCCSETSKDMCFATPKWLYDMGCGGGFYPPFPDENPEWWKKTHNPYKAEQMQNPEKYCNIYWEPDYFDPLFLEYLEKFIKEYAKKFDNDPRIEYVDMGSYGNWGEGHTSCGSMRRGSFELYKKHVLMHMKYFKNKYVLLNDDFVNQMEGNSRKDIHTWSNEKQELMDYCISAGMGLRDDSILAGPDYHEREYHTISTPEMFDKFYKNAPVDIEGAHYVTYTNDDSKDGLVFIEALRRAHATYAGFHGYPGEWLKNNYYITEYLANRIGYWYFVNEIEHAEKADAGTQLRIALEWENKGYGLCYKRYELEIKFVSENNKEFIYSLPESDNRKFMSESTAHEVLFATLDENMKSGEYSISLRLAEKSGNTVIPIKLGLKSDIMDENGFYKVSKITIY